MKKAGPCDRSNGSPLQTRRFVASRLTSVTPRAVIGNRGRWTKINCLSISSC
jgi:hypothetical protein